MTDENATTNTAAPSEVEAKTKAPAQVEKREGDRRGDERREGDRDQPIDPMDEIARKLKAGKKKEQEERLRIAGAKQDRRDRDRRRVADRRSEIMAEDEEIKAKQKEAAADGKLKKLGKKAKKRASDRKKRRKRRRAMIRKIVSWAKPLVYLGLLAGIIYAVVAYWPQMARMLK